MNVDSKMRSFMLIASFYFTNGIYYSECVSVSYLNVLGVKWFFFHA